MRPLVTMRDALSDPKLLGKALPGDSFALWRTLLIAAMGEPLNYLERELFKAVTGREVEPSMMAVEFWAIAGRRSGKTRAAAAAATYLAALCDHSHALASGERGVLPILAASTTQASRAFHHVNGILEASPIISQQVEARTTDTIRLTNRVDIEVRAANFRTIRGVTAVAAIGDEVAFWMVEGSTNSDSEILNALRPALATTGGPLWCISSPYARRGELWQAYRRYYGPNGDPEILVASGPSKRFNPTLSDKVIKRAAERDPAAYLSEWMGQFRTDLEAFISLEVVEPLVETGVRERGRILSNSYHAFVDPSGGSSDSMTLAIAHKEGDRIILDAIREARSPFSPEAVVSEFAAVCKLYGVSSVTGDRYAGEWPREQFRKHHIRYDISVRNRSEIYLDTIPLLTSGRAELLDNSALLTQLVGLERRRGRAGKDNVDHAPGAHDDVANAACGALLLANIPRTLYTRETIG